MNKKELEKFVSKGLSTRELAQRFECSQTNIRYYLKKYGMKTDRSLKNLSETRVCPSCKQEKSRGDFYFRRGSYGTSAYCKVCTNLQTVQRNRKLKRLAVEYKGGSCTICGYSTYDGALEFHHLDPSKKDFSLSSRKSKSLTLDIEQELDKCALLCSNCHKEEHARIRGLL